MKKLYMVESNSTFWNSWGRDDDSSFHGIFTDLESAKNAAESELEHDRSKVQIDLEEESYSFSIYIFELELSGSKYEQGEILFKLGYDLGEDDDYEEEDL